MPWKETKFVREQLYQEVWAEPVSKLAKRYGLSDVGLRKICKRLNVPMPPLGWWAKKAHGKATRVIALPKNSDETEYIRRVFVDPEEVARRRKVDRELSTAEPLVLGISLQSSPEQWHPLAARTAKALRVPGRFDKGLMTTKPGPVFRLSVSPDSRERAVVLLDGLIRGLESVGSVVRKQEKEPNWLFVELDGEKLSFSIAEGVRRQERELTPDEKRELAKSRFAFIPDRYVHTPSGLLRLTILGETERELAKYADTARTKLETRLDELFSAFRRAAVTQRVRRIEAEKQRKKWEEEERLRARRADIANKELTRLKEIEQRAGQWERAGRLRRYADAVEAMAKRDGLDLSERAEWAKKVAWIRHAADWLDPTVDAKWPEVDGAQAPYWWWEYQRKMGGEP